MHRDAWIRSGVTDRRLASAEFTSPIPGYHHRGAYIPSLRELGGVIQRDYAPGAVISHATAAEHLGWPLPLRLMHRRTGTLHASSATRELRNRRVVIHRRQGMTGVRVGGLVVTSVEETLADIAPLLHHDELVGVMDALLVPHRPWAPARTRTPPLTRAELGRRIGALRPGRRGVRAVRAAFRDAREGVDSVMETRLRLLVHRLGFEEPTVNPCVVAPDTGERFWVDLAYPERRIAIEYDGKETHGPGSGRLSSDLVRQDVLHALGWRVLRVVHADLEDCRRLVARMDGAGCPMGAGGVRTRARELERLDEEWSRRTGGTV